MAVAYNFEFQTVNFGKKQQKSDNFVEKTVNFDEKVEAVENVINDIENKAVPEEVIEEASKAFVEEADKSSKKKKKDKAALIESINEAVENTSEDDLVKSEA